ncbi:hypothetical protein B0H15DRAFT_807673 [Mycena belliarum]|uniref:Ribonuclease H1 N-terminal domain-containing protein n=1 Tax=Mycena belliarum TaxID=1033014 RepID=A0AAD6XHJ4_9AGAR|nr:hypothetical protein B0H15DRAFT_807673 [Mycena belliae]
MNLPLTQLAPQVVLSQPAMMFAIAIVPSVVVIGASPAMVSVPSAPAALPHASRDKGTTVPLATASPDVAPTTALTAPAPATRTPAGAGLPAPLVALLRSDGPWLANEVYSVTPTEALDAIEEAVAAPECALSAVAITGVANAARKAYTTQALALTAFNQALTWGGVQPRAWIILSQVPGFHYSHSSAFPAYPYSRASISSSHRVRLSQAMAAPDLTPAEIAELIRPSNHPARLTADELDHLTAHLTDAQLEEVVSRLGHADLARQLPPLLSKILRVAQQLTRDTPPEYDDEIHRVLRNMEIIDLSDPPTPPSSPEPPHTPANLTTAPSPSQTQRAGRFPKYTVTSPSKLGDTVSWFEAGALAHGVPGTTVRGGGSARRARKPPSAAYAVFYGGVVGTFTNWNDARASITGHGLAIHCGFPSITAADAALAYARARGWTGDSTPPQPPTSSPLPLPSSYDDNPLNAGGNNLWYAVCCGVAPGVYRSYLECALNTCGVKGNRCSSFATREAAESAYTEALSNGWVRIIPRAV